MQNEPIPNRILKNLCEAFLKDRRPGVSGESEGLCILHGEKLKLYCMEDQQPVCLVCRDARTHIDHRFHPITDVASEYKVRVLHLVDYTIL